jgi:osmoprotectant transport system substrate-binding protein
MRKWNIRLLLLAVAAVAALVIAACGSSNDNSSSSGSSSAATTASGSSGGGQPGKGKSITLGTKNFTEAFVLGELYKQALEAKGFTVNYKKNLGSSEIADKSLTSGQIDAYPEYVGIFLSTTAGDTKTYASVEEAYAAAKAFAEKRGDTFSTLTPFTDTDAIGVTKAYAQKNNLASVADLAPLGSKVRMAGPPEFKSRFTGLKGLASEYGVKPTFVPLAIGLQYKALDTGKVDAADVFTTDGQLQGGKYVVLKDPKNIFGFQNVGMITSKKASDAAGPAYAETVDAVSAKLTTEAMQQMNAAVDIDKQDPAAVAKQFLQANGLLGG